MASIILTAILLVLLWLALVISCSKVGRVVLSVLFLICLFVYTYAPRLPTYEDELKQREVYLNTKLDCSRYDDYYNNLIVFLVLHADSVRVKAQCPEVYNAVKRIHNLKISHNVN